MTRRDLLFGFLLAFIGGLADGTSFIGADIFTAGVTGNYIFLSIALFEGFHYKDILRMVSLPLFIIFSSLYEMIPVTYLARKDRLSFLLRLEAIFLLLAGLSPFLVQDTFYVKAAVVICSILAMATQFRLSRQWKKAHGLTTVMTANTVMVSQTIGKLLTGRKLQSGDDRDAFKMNWFKIGGFIGGCCFSAIGFHFLGFKILIVASLLLTVISFKMEG